MLKIGSIHKSILDMKQILRSHKLKYHNHFDHAHPKTMHLYQHLYQLSPPTHSILESL